MPDNRTHTYRIRFVHKVATAKREYDQTVMIGADDTIKEICAKLRTVGALHKGQRVREWRKEADRIVVFPMAWRGITTVWHSIILERADEKTIEAFYHLYGYRIESQHAILYEACNHAQDSQTVIDPRSDAALPLAQIERFAKQVLDETAAKFREAGAIVTVIAPKYDREEEARIARHRGESDALAEAKPC